MLNEPFDFNGNFFTSSSSPKIFGLRPKSKSRPKIWIYPYYSLPLPGLILLHNSKVFRLLNNYPPPVVRFVEVFYARKFDLQANFLTTQQSKCKHLLHSLLENLDHGELRTMCNTETSKSDQQNLFHTCGIFVHLHT